MAFVTDRQIGLFLQMKLFKRFLEVYKDIMKDCKYSSKLANPPIRVNMFYILL